ncbi:MAG: hypothetical protein GF331_12500 [Chitinivibrionales bacterium]|nr:hypothetical protein [Chitinivibrionales bacterium]
MLADNFWSHLLGRHYHLGYSHTMEKQAATRRSYQEAETINRELFLRNEHTDAIRRNLREAVAADIPLLVRKREVAPWPQEVLTALRNYPAREKHSLRHFPLAMIDEYIQVCRQEIPRLFAGPSAAVASVATRYRVHALAEK